MRIDLNLNRPGNTIINAARVNASFAKHNNNEDDKTAGNRMRKDRVTLSPQGKLMSMIENLTQQKQTLVERRNDLVESTLKDGGKVEDIKDQLKSYKKQIEAIDKQISNTYAQQARQCMEQDEKKDAAKADKNKTTEQLEAEHLNNLAGITRDLKQAEKISSLKEHTEGEARIKESEVIIGNVHVDALESKELQGAKVDDLIESETGALARKEKEIDQLWDKASELAFRQGDIIRDSREELEKAGENKETDDTTSTPSVETAEKADTDRADIDKTDTSKTV